MNLEKKRTNYGQLKYKIKNAAGKIKIKIIKRSKENGKSHKC